MPLPKAVLWDLDGVLADTSQLHFQTWAQVLGEYSIPFSREKFHYIFGLKNHDFLPILAGRYLESELIEQISEQKERAFRQGIREYIHLFPGVLDWLHRFKSWGCKQAVASSAPPENIEALVRELGILEYFDALVNPGELPGKPHPGVFLKASSILAVPVEGCIVIEDSIPGIEAACRAGIRCIAVANTNPPEALAQADLVVESLQQLTTDQIISLVRH